MYLRMLYLQADTDKKPDMLKIMDHMIPKIRAQKGCKDCMFIMQDDEGRYALLVFWDSKQNADAAAPVIGPEMLPALNKIAKKPLNPILYEVYQPMT